MIFTVTWLPSAQDELARIWMAALDRKAVADASNQIDRELRQDGHLKGVPFQGFFLFEIAPLMVKFAVSLNDRIIEVIDVKRSVSGNGSIH
ncbi:MAG: hypothetical protein U0793_25565 [Gemmataceae bacterium]